MQYDGHHRKIFNIFIFDKEEGVGPSLFEHTAVRRMEVAHLQECKCSLMELCSKTKVLSSLFLGVQMA